MKKTLLFALIMMVVAGISSCMGPLTESDNGRTIELSELTPFDVVLKGFPDSPLVWKAISYDSTVIKFLGPARIMEFNENGKPIKSFQFEFQTISSGETILQMALLPPDDMEAIPAKTFEIRVISGTMGRIEAQ
ncbi:MAG: protease inhibitor I42 family protein [Bacteroidetes bacterium]|nr:protease inhibitor I42 family protein [Bacteroidota bacterium]